MKQFSALCKGLGMGLLLLSAVLSHNFVSAQISAPYNLEVIFNNDLVPIVDLIWDHNTDAFTYFLIERDGDSVGTSTIPYYTEAVPCFCTFCYQVYAVYDEGISEPCAPDCTFDSLNYLFLKPDWLEGDTIGFDVVLGWWMDTTSIASDLLGYNIYRDSTQIAYIPFTGEDTAHYTDEAPEPMCYDYYVSAIHDLSVYGLPGDTGESQQTGPDEVCLVSGTTLPFIEDWSSGSFGSIWTNEQNWVVNGQIGDPEPSAEFKWNPMLYNYSECLISGAFNGVSPATKDDPYVDGHFILSFDVKLNDVNATGDEKFNVEVWTEGNWTRVTAFNNSDGSFDWLHKEIDITNIAFGKIFKVRFMAEGILSSDILSWFVDNISIERVCYPPAELAADYIDPITVELNWHPPYSGATEYEWIMWDDATNVDGIGLTGGGVFSVASHWDPDMLEEYIGRFITKIRFFVYPNVVNTVYTLKVWEGLDAATLVYEQPVGNYIVSDWNTITLNTPVQIDESKELWFGYTADSPDGENPASCDGGPAVVGYGDMITLDGVTWDPITNFGFDLNWNLHALISDTTGKMIAQSREEDISVYSLSQGSQLTLSAYPAKEAIGTSTKDTLLYHVYYSDNGAGYVFIGQTMDTTYHHVIEDGFPVGNLPCYYVKAVYEDCDANSNEACAIGGPGTVGDDLDSKGVLSVYPNPAKELVYIESESQIKQLCLLDYNGRMLKCKEGLSEKNVTIDVSGYEPGLYLLRINTEQGRAVRKFIVSD